MSLLHCTQQAVAASSLPLIYGLQIEEDRGQEYNIIGRKEYYISLSYCGIIVTYYCTTCIKISKNSYIYFMQENLSLEQIRPAFLILFSQNVHIYGHYL